jgi:hypothetical protein
MSLKLFEQTAYHESGHIIMAHLSGYKSDMVTLIQSDPGTGKTKFNYGSFDITLLIAAMQKYDEDPSIFHDLNNTLKNVAPQVAIKIVGTILGGPVSEAYYKTGIDFVGELPIEMSGPDLLSVQSIHNCMIDNFPNHDANFINSQFKNVTAILREQQFWNAIEHLSVTLLNSPEKQLNKQQIEQSLSESGYLEFIDKV